MLRLTRTFAARIHKVGYTMQYIYQFFELLGMLPTAFFIHLGIANVNWVFNISNKYLFGHFGFSIGYFCKC